MGTTLQSKNKKPGRNTTPKWVCQKGSELVDKPKESVCKAMHPAYPGKASSVRKNNTGE